MRKWDKKKQQKYTTSNPKQKLTKFYETKKRRSKVNASLSRKGEKGKKRLATGIVYNQ